MQIFDKDPIQYADLPNAGDGVLEGQVSAICGPPHEQRVRRVQIPVDLLLEDVAIEDLDAHEAEVTRFAAFAGSDARRDGRLRAKRESTARFPISGRKDGEITAAGTPHAASQARIGLATPVRPRPIASVLCQRISQDAIVAQKPDC